MENLIFANTHLTKKQLILLSIVGLLFIIGFLITANSIIKYYNQGAYVAIFPISLLLIAFITILYYSYAGHDKGIKYYKIGFIFFILSVLFGIIPLITYKYSFPLIFTIVEVLLLIIFLMKMNEPKVAQKIIKGIVNNLINN